MYRTENVSLQFNNYTIDIERITNIDELYNALIAKGSDHEDVKDERIPYWAELWPSAVALSHYIADLDWDWKTKNILEIGSGLGLPSILCAAMGANVTTTDYLQDAVDFSAKNAAKNNIENIKFSTLDWRKPQLDYAADVLIAADVAYEKRMFENLPLAFETLCKPNGTILLSEPNRAFAQDFLNQLKQMNVEIKSSQRQQELFSNKYLINILEIKRK
jgi:predicted nicotinamide N-methyase